MTIVISVRNTNGPAFSGKDKVALVTRHTVVRDMDFPDDPSAFKEQSEEIAKLGPGAEVHVTIHGEATVSVGEAD